PAALRPPGGASGAGAGDVTGSEPVANQIVSPRPIARPPCRYASATHAHTLWQSRIVAMIPPLRTGRGPAMCSARGRNVAIATSGSSSDHLLLSRRPAGLSAPQP